MMEGWKKDKLINIIAQITTGKLDANAMVPNGEYRFYTCAKDYCYIDSYAFDDEALLVSGNGEYVGYIHYYKGKFNAYQRVYVLTGFKINVKYLENYLNRYLPIRINKEVSQNNIPYIRLSTLSKMDVLFPESLSEQASIANILSSVDEAIDSVKKSVEAAEKLKKSMMQNLLTGRMKPDGTFRTEDEFYEDEKFGKVPKGWEVKKVKELSDSVQYGLNQASSENGEIPMLRMNNILKGKMTDFPLVYVDLNDTLLNQYKLAKGDILFNRTNSMDLVGKVGIFELDGDFVFASYLIRVKVSPANNSSYVNYALNSYPIQCSLRSKATPAVSQANINSNSLRNTSILIPINKDEQDMIVSIISKIEEQINNKQNQIITLERLKKSLMQNLLTGKVRVGEEGKKEVKYE